MRLSNLVNIGPKLEMLLNEVGIHDSEELRAIGSVEATYRLCEKNKECVNKLYSLEGAIRGTRWHNISKDDKEILSLKLESKLEIATV